MHYLVSNITVQQTVGMLKNMAAFQNMANDAIERTAAGGVDGQKITYNVIKNRMGDILYKLTSMKFEDPAEGEEAVKYVWTM